MKSIQLHSTTSEIKHYVYVKFSARSKIVKYNTLRTMGIQSDKGEVNMQ